jgi:hypothetical protein
MKCIKQLLFFSIVMFSVLCCSAQVVVSLQLPPSGILQKNQLWNMLVVNGAGEKFNMVVELNVFDSRNGNRVFSATSRLIEVSSGAKQMRMNDLMPIQYQYINSLYQMDAGMNGLLPVGLFKFCYNFFRINEKGKLPLSEECREMEIAPLSPPQLMMPQDSAVLEALYPQFSWTPPTPANSFKGLHYELRVVELQKDQNSTDAIQKNIPFAERGNLKEPFFAYPSSLPAFDTSVLYGWQITATDLNGYAAKSEVWTFSLSKRTLNKLKVTNSYVWLQRGEDPALFISNGRVKFSYNNLISQRTASYQLVNVSGNTQQVVRSGKVSLSDGQNFIDLNLEDKKFWKENELYRFELVNDKGEKWLLNIKFIEKEENQ